MRNAFYVAFTLIAAFAFGCTITNYPVMFDTRGPDDEQIVDTFYDKAYIIPTGQFVTIYDDGSDELFNVLTQDWRGDQWIYQYNNFDPTATVLFLDQTYCDPTRQTLCSPAIAWNPDLPEAYPFGSSPINGTDDPFDWIYDESCSGARSISLLLSQGTRFGECGSGMWSDKQAVAAEFADLEPTTLHGRSFYALPFDASNARIRVHSLRDDVSANMPIYGRYQAYVDERFRFALRATPNAKYQARWVESWTSEHGPWSDVEVTYRGVSFEVSVEAVLKNVDRL
jgi:hypothetical protein